MREKFMIMVLIIAAAMAEIFPGVSAQDAAGKAQQLIAQARAALGGDKLKSLSVTGNYRRTLGQMEMAGEVSYDLLLPDKMMKTETMNPMPSLEITRIEALNGEDVWEDQQQHGGGGRNDDLPSRPRRPRSRSPESQGGVAARRPLRFRAPCDRLAADYAIVIPGRIQFRRRGRIARRESRRSGCERARRIRHTVVPGPEDSSPLNGDLQRQETAHHDANGRRPARTEIRRRWRRG